MFGGAAALFGGERCSLPSRRRLPSRCRRPRRVRRVRRPSPEGSPGSASVVAPVTSGEGSSLSGASAVESAPAPVARAGAGWGARGGVVGRLMPVLGCALLRALRRGAPVAGGLSVALRRARLCGRCSGARPSGCAPLPSAAAGPRIASRPTAIASATVRMLAGRARRAGAGGWVGMSTRSTLRGRPAGDRPSPIRSTVSSARLTWKYRGGRVWEPRSARASGGFALAPGASTAWLCFYKAAEREVQRARSDGGGVGRSGERDQTAEWGGPASAIRKNRPAGGEPCSGRNGSSSSTATKRSKPENSSTISSARPP